MAKNARRFLPLISHGFLVALACLLLATTAFAGEPTLRDPSSALGLDSSKAMAPIEKGLVDNPQDGGFEQADMFWAEFSSGGFDVICDVNCGASGQRAGLWYAWLGGVAGQETSSVSQTVTVGANDRFLTFWTWFENCDSDGTDLDEFVVSFDATTLFMVDETSPRCGETGHHRTVVDISAFAGGTYDLEFQFNGEGPAITNIYIDDVQILETLEPDKIVDGGFELGSPSPVWTEASTNFGTPICNQACGGGGQRSGDWWAWFGGTTNFEIGSVAQDVVLAPQDTTLSFWLTNDGCDTDATNADFFAIEIDGVQEFFRDENSELCGEQVYRRYLVDISAYADGGSHEFVFTGTTHGPGVANFYLDDVQILTSLEAYYPFDTDTSDLSPNGRHATLEGAAVIGDGVVGDGALDLTGGDGWADIVDPVLLDDAECSIAYLVRFDTLVPNDTGDTCCNSIFSEDDFFFGALHNNVDFLGGPPTLIEWVIGGNSIDLEIPAPTSTPSEWMHLAMTYNQSTGETIAYQNGGEVATVFAPQLTLCGSGQSSSIGAWETGAGMERFVDASIDELWIYSRILSAEEIRDLVSPDIFADGFELGDYSAWSAVVGAQ